MSRRADYRYRSACTGLTRVARCVAITSERRHYGEHNGHLTKIANLAAVIPRLLLSEPRLLQSRAR